MTLEFRGRKVRPGQLAGLMEQSVFEHVRDQLVRKIEDICDPVTGARPGLRVTGDDLDSLKIEVEGSQELVEEVNRRLR